MSTKYESELAQLSATYTSALSSNSIDNLKAAIQSAAESSVIAVGSGGSYTVASLLCNLHEKYTGRVSRASTPLEIVCNPTLASSSPVFLISAEGKNPDITEALLRARKSSARTIHVLTNREDSQLMEHVNSLTNVTGHVFPLQDKDGYLATNSLLLDAVLVARAYAELDRKTDALPNAFDELKVGSQRIEEWVNTAQDFAREANSRGALTIIYSPLLKPIAADLESKLSESALLHVQLADLRSYAHGRHLWLANRPQDCAVLALVEPTTKNLWEQMKALFPGDVPTLTMSLADDTPKELVSGLIAQMHLIASIAKQQGRDIGKPEVPSFGRQLYYIDLPSAIPNTNEDFEIEKSKLNVIGAKWPFDGREALFRRVRESVVNDFASRKFRAVVFDYDGTLCSSQRADAPLTKEMLNRLQRLVENDIVVGIASGRGGSVQEGLIAALPSAIAEKIQLGLYNCGWIDDATKPPINSGETSEFLSHVARIVHRLKEIGVPIQTVKSTPPHQISIRFREGLSTDTMWFVVADALRQAGLDVSRLVRSKHSVDVLASGIGKSRLIAHIISKFQIEPYDILAMGDQGAWPGNDFALLEHRYSLSVDEPSRRMDRGWKLAPPHKRDVDATHWYLERFEPSESGSFTIDLGK